MPNPAIAEYVLPLRWSGGAADDEPLLDLTRYLAQLRRWVDVTVVDGSVDDEFALHSRLWSHLVRHVRPTVSVGLNGKTRGVLSGVDMARHELIIIADDDVRYDRQSLLAVVDRLRAADLVRPHNYFHPLPWHARWDTGRTLMNRAVLGDYPGTYGLRRSIMRRIGGYDPNALFENLELERTVRAAGGIVHHSPEIIVARRPPTVTHFLGQRVRQAYDSWAQPLRLVAEAALLPTIVCARRHPAVLTLCAASVIAIAEFGRQRHSGRAVYPASSSLWAPLWVMERAITSWMAIFLRLRGGPRYSDGRMPLAAHQPRTLRRLLTNVQRRTYALYSPQRKEEQWPLSKTSG
ncbi:glycosyltransferase [Microbacterium sp. YY-01]|uniref:glycosyltransferase n=1 Tax=Microbacterium sp. YY-01 TaxID=3421634 RepID=UPI003D17796A